MVDVDAARWERKIDEDRERRLIGSLLSPQMCGIISGSFAYVVCSTRFSFSFYFFYLHTND